MRVSETTSLWYRPDGIKLKTEYALMYVRSLLAGIRRSLEKGGYYSGNMEKDIQKDMEALCGDGSFELTIPDDEPEVIPGIEQVFNISEFHVGVTILCLLLVLTLEEQSQELRRLSAELKDFKVVYTKRVLQDSYRFAEMAEAEDYKMNLANSDRVMITGVLLLIII